MAEPPSDVASSAALSRLLTTTHPAASTVTPTGQDGGVPSRRIDMSTA
jgi:hypothetical protein